MKWLTKPISTLLSLFFVGCSSASIQDYKGTKPHFEFEKFFTGPLTAKGVLQKRGGLVTRKFEIKMRGEWKGNEGSLYEDFVYDDGEKYNRVWKIKKQSDGHYVGTAHDIIGEGIGRTEGFALQWQYTMAVPVDGKVYHINFDDWMYMVDEKTLINRSQMSKFGFELAQVLLVITKE